MSEQVILVDGNDVQLGTMEKLEAHRQGILHRAFSIFVFNDKNELLLQQRAFGKYHSPGLWTNSCCSHPRPGERLEIAARRRLMEEMGISCDLNNSFSFIYKAEVGNNLIEHEYDHVFIGRYNGEPVINKNEVNDWKYLSLDSVRDEINNFPEKFTIWFKSAFEKVALSILSDNKNGTKKK